MKDIKAERAKISEKDNLRLLYVTKWFLEFFLCERAIQKNGAKWKFGYIAEVTDRGWIVWVLRRMREAHDEKVYISYTSPTPSNHFPTIAKALERTPSWCGVPHTIRACARGDDRPFSSCDW